MRWLVTGGAGFIGSHLVDALAATGEGEVVALDNLRRGSWSHLGALDANRRVHRIEADIRDAEAMREAVRGADVVFHLAAQSNVMGASKDIQYSAETNVLGTVNVLVAALDSGVRRVVFASSREVYGDPASLPVPETQRCAPINAYGASKVAAEAYCQAFAERGLGVAVLRLANVYGPRDSGRVIPLWLDRARRGLPLEIYGEGKVLDFIWIGLVVEALLRAASIESLPGALNVGSGRGTPLVELAERIIAVTNTESEVRVLPARNEEVGRFAADTSAMRACLGLEPPADPLSHLAELARQLAETPAR